MLKTPTKRQPLFHLATGGGKSVIFRHISEQTITQNKKVLFLVAGTSILDQAVTKHFQGDVSVMQGGKKFRMSDVLCCSMDTLSRRKKIHDEIIAYYDLIIIDEAHLCTANRYTDFLSKIPKDKWVIGFTATPYRIGKKGHTFWSHVIKKISVEKLVEQGFLMRPKIFAAPVMNTGVKKTAGDFNTNELFSVNDTLKVYGNILQEYEKHAKGLRSVCFCINIAHSKLMAERFTEAGYEAVHVDANTPLEERARLIARLEDDDDPLLILCNVNVLSTGVDIPKLECGLMARPTHSLVLWIQQVGRILRICAGKCIILDFGENTRRLAHPLDDLEAETMDIEKGSGAGSGAPVKLSYWNCPECFFLAPKTDMKCPECGYKPKAPELKKSIDVELVEFGKQKITLNLMKFKYETWRKSYIDETYPNSKIKQDFERIYKNHLATGKKPNAMFYAMADIYELNDLIIFFKRVPNWLGNS